MNNQFKKLLTNANLTPLENQVFMYIADNINTCLDLGVREISKATFTSTTTIIRIAKKLGYKGFVDMIYSIAPIINNSTEIYSDDYFPTSNINSIMKYNSSSDIDTFIDMLLSCNNGICIFSTGFTSIPAEYLFKKFSMSKLEVYYSNGNDPLGLFTSKLSNADIMIVMSKSGETPIALRRAKNAKELNIPVISFTKEDKNSLATLSNINFKIYDMHKFDDDNTLSNTYFPDLLMLIEYLHYKYERKKHEKIK